MSPTGFHHINFIVRDLDEAIANYERMLGVAPFIVVDHPLRLRSPVAAISTTPR